MSEQPAAPTEKKKNTSKTPEAPPPGKLVLNAREVAYLTGLAYDDIRKLVMLRALPCVEFPSTEPLRKRADRPRSRRSRARTTQPGAARRLLFARSDIELFIEKCKRTA